MNSIPKALIDAARIIANLPQSKMSVAEKRLQQAAQAYLETQKGPHKIDPVELANTPRQRADSEDILGSASLI